MRAALAALLPIALLGCADPLTRCTAPATRELDRLDALVVESETALARGYRLEEPRVRGPFVGLCAGSNNVLLCSSSDLTPAPRPVAIVPSAERARLDALRARQEIARQQAAALARSCAAAR